MKLISGRANPKLAQAIASYLKINLTPATITPFMDGETYVKIEESVRGSDVFIIQPTSPNVNQNLMELLIMIDAAKRASASSITCLIPYYGYARQDRKAHPREPITAKLVANLITIAGANRVLTVDLHAGQLQGFFDIPVDDLWAYPIFARYFKKMKLENAMVISPDAGGVKRASMLATTLGVPLGFVEKRRDAHNASKVLHLIGDVKGKSCILVDDIVDTGGTLVNAAKHMKDNGAKEVYIAVTHSLMNGDCVEKLKKADIKELVTTNSIDIPDEKKIDKLKVISLAPYFAEAIYSIHHHMPMSSVYEDIKDLKIL